MIENTQNQSIITALTELGLGQNEAILYEILLKNPDATIPTLTKNSQFTRTMLYYVLNHLISLELATSGKIGKKTIYNAAPPEKLDEFLADQEKELFRQKNTLKQVMGDLGSVYRLAHNKPGVRFFEGIDGIRKALKDCLTAKETVYTFSDSESLDKYAREVNEEHIKDRIKFKIKKHILVIDSPFTRSQEYKRKKESEGLTQVKFLPNGMPSFHTSVQIYDNKVTFLTLREKNIIGFILTDPDIYLFQRNLFELLWNITNHQNHNNQQPITPKIPTPPAVISELDKNKTIVAHNDDGTSTVFKD